nr:MAG TPA: hypothetical protein [Caudoviricetes sp.]
MKTEVLFGLMAVVCAAVVAVLCCRFRVYETTAGTICCGVIAFIGLVCLYLAMDGRREKRK